MRVLIFVGGLLASAACAARPTAPETSLVRLVTYNIHAGKDADGRDNLDRVAALMDSLDADVVLLQEVDRGTERSGRVDQLAQLERRTGMSGAFGKSLDFQGGQYGIAALSRWPITSAETLPLPVDPPQERSGGSHEPRAMLHLVVATPAGPLHVVNTHLDPTGAGTYRRQELIAVLARLRRRVPPDAALVLGGDLNARPDTDDITALSFSLHDAWAACGASAPRGGETFPASSPDRRIDYVFFRSGRCRRAEVVTSTASDHRPFFVLLQFR